MEVTPYMAWIYYFLLFVLIVCIFLNLIIAVIGGAYSEVSQYQFTPHDGEEFLLLVAHDTSVWSWEPDQAQGFASWLRDGPVVRELQYWWALMQCMIQACVAK